MGVSVGKRVAAAAALLFFLGPPAAAQVPDPYARQLAAQLAEGEQFLAERGYSRAAGPFAGGLNPRAVRRFEVTLRAGQDYRVLGVCDARCNDLNLTLFDSNDVLVTQDRLSDDVPILEVRPTLTGAHTIEVEMYSCAAAPCYFAFNVYAR